MSQKKLIQLISPAEIRAVYARGEEAVVELVTGLVEHIARIEARLTELEGQVKKTSHNSRANAHDSLQRIAVLPEVDRSRIGAEYNQPICHDCSIRDKF